MARKNDGDRDPESFVHRGKSTRDDAVHERQFSCGFSFSIGAKFFRFPRSFFSGNSPALFAGVAVYVLVDVDVDVDAEIHLLLFLVKHRHCNYSYS